jgi:hypothetical protein
LPKIHPQVTHSTFTQQVQAKAQQAAAYLKAHKESILPNIASCVYLITKIISIIK